MIKFTTLAILALAAGYGFVTITKPEDMGTRPADRMVEGWHDPRDPKFDQCVPKRPYVPKPEDPITSARVNVYREWRKKHYREFEGCAYSSDSQCDDLGDYEQPTIEIQQDNNGGLEGELDRQGLTDVIEKRSNN
ncbi:hypothetical protein EP7_004274 [Isosphaeraceae bacterium EP7]